MTFTYEYCIYALYMPKYKTLDPKNSKIPFQTEAPNPTKVRLVGRLSVSTRFQYTEVSYRMLPLSQDHPGPNDVIHTTYEPRGVPPAFEPCVL